MGWRMSLYSVESESYKFMIKKHNKEVERLTEAYKNAVAWLAFSGLMNAALLMAWFWEVIH
jgi:hypothetical protein